MRRWCVVRHLAHGAIERSVVYEMTVLLEVIDEKKMVGEIGPSPWRQKRRPRKADQDGDEECDDTRPRDQIGDATVALARQHGGAGQDQRHRQRAPRLDAEARRVQEVTGDGRKSKPSRYPYRDRFSSRKARALQDA